MNTVFVLLSTAYGRVGHSQFVGVFNTKEDAKKYKQYYEANWDSFKKGYCPSLSINKVEYNPKIPKPNVPLVECDNYNKSTVQILHLSHRHVVGRNVSYIKFNCVFKVNGSDASQFDDLKKWFLDSIKDDSHILAGFITYIKEFDCFQYTDYIDESPATRGLIKHLEDIKNGIQEPTMSTPEYEFKNTLSALTFFWS